MAAAYAILAGSSVPCKGNGMEAVWADETSRLMGKWIFDNQINKKVHVTTYIVAHMNFFHASILREPAAHELQYPMGHAIRVGRRRRRRYHDRRLI